MFGDRRREDVGCFPVPDTSKLQQTSRAVISFARRRAAHSPRIALAQFAALRAYAQSPHGTILTLGARDHAALQGAGETVAQAPRLSAAAAR